VDRARVDCLVRTLVSALSASVSCRVVRPDGCAADDMLCVGSSISPGDCHELVRSCGAVVEKLGNSDGDMFFNLVHVAWSGCHWRCQLTINALSPNVLISGYDIV
jgi:hypothetical protein